jgi:hypothetical protein
VRKCLYSMDMETTTDTGTLRDYETNDFIRPATSAELEASILAAEGDGGAGVIDVDGRSCWVEGPDMETTQDIATDPKLYVLRTLPEQGIGERLQNNATGHGDHETIAANIANYVIEIDDVEVTAGPDGVIRHPETGEELYIWSETETSSVVECPEHGYNEAAHVLSCPYAIAILPADLRNEN